MMSNKQMLRFMISERLSETAEEIFALFEQSIAEYQREIERLKKEASESKQTHAALGQKPSSEEAPECLALNGENAESFHCKEETEQVMITWEEDPQMQITDVQSLNKRDEPHGRQTEERETDNSLQPLSESEGEDSDSDEQPSVSDKPKKTDFSQEIDVKMHVRSVHEEPLTSAESHAQMDSEHSLLQPEMESGEARSFSCTVCGRSFHQMISLEAHMREHDGEHLFRCAECSVTFVKEAKFFRHMKAVHSIEKPFKCAVCHKCLKTAHAHRTHMLIHTGERPFKCPVCGRGFVQKVSLKNHMVTHTGEKPYRCRECGKNYSTSQSLMIHLRLIHR